MRHICTALSVLLFLTLMPSCTDGMAGFDSRQVDIDGWQRADTLTFHLTDLQKGSSYCAELDIRITDAYPLMTLALAVKQTLHANRKTVVDTVFLQVYDDVGRMLGKGLTRKAYSLPLTTLTPTVDDSLTITLHHIMMQDTLPGITDIGVRLKRVKGGI